MNGVLQDISINLVASIIFVVFTALVTALRKQGWLQKQIPIWVGLILFALAIGITILVAEMTNRPAVDDLGAYQKLDLVTGDLNNTDFGWVSGDDRQTQHPSLVDTSLEGINGTLMQYPIELRSTKDNTGYSVGNLIALPERKLRDAERGAWDTLLTTVYVQSAQPQEVFILPYLKTPNAGKIFLGFGQSIPTNHWMPVVWRSLTDSMIWSDDFFIDLFALRDKYGIREVGHLRLAQVLTLEKTEGTMIGFELRLLSNKAIDVEDTLLGNFYISSLTFLPQ